MRFELRKRLLQRRLNHFDAKVHSLGGFRAGAQEGSPMGETNLSGQIAVVTGAGRGIGAAIAMKFAKMGATTVLCGRTERTLKETASKISAEGGKAEPIRCDVCDLGSVQDLADAVEQKFGRLDILVNNAGVGSFSGPLHELTPQAWEKVLNTNLRGVFYCIRGFAPMMIRQNSGYIVNISSLAGKNALPNGAAYAASKWGLNGLTYSVAEELRGHNIRVSVVCPGSVDTELGPHTGKNPSKMLKPDDVAHVVAMLVTQTPQSFASEVLIRPTLKP
jgi:NAD(P)-dependent dehydrogenase (short-subunit alcohol dehydrogenase family)